LERFNLKELNEVVGKEQYHVEISNKFAALENLYPKHIFRKARGKVTTRKTKK
jgi:hypothetical protein